ncbi:Type 1 glutamine amidotransferase-like domain-containing protein [Bradyrhizobium sp. SZCCHNRI20481]|uniref:Type 1 glutamine amidotransferase-like domain-containing protein n=1 Tax=Bradyrhizobium sp. SZCCHNRI20481 TaxID=3057286 RepID=UPI00291619DD|nr:Type 1 glutamine amidotransferase-like domain-containing protein [Bradyrhizobium sp. SZCCHNRI20481]
MQAQIIAMGGGGFSTEPANLKLERYILAQARRPTPRVCFLASGSGDPNGYTVRYYSAFNSLDCKPSHLSLFKLPSADLASFLLDQDVVYVGGGNTRSLLGLWMEWDLDRHLRTAWENGVILAGTSAGAMVWYEEGLTDSLPNQLVPLACLGFLSGSYCPHFSSEEDRAPKFRSLIATGAMSSGVGVDDGVALHYMGNDLHAAVAARQNAGARFIDRVNGTVEEREVEVHLLK